MKLLIGSLLLAGTIYGQDLSYRVRQLILSQTEPVTVNVSVRNATMIEFPAQIQAIGGDGFTQKTDEQGDFYFAPGANWISIRSLHAGARQNMGVVIAGRVYEIVIQTADENDYSVLFRFDNQNEVAAK